MPHVLITGAGRGIGRTLAAQYHDAGWAVTATVREPERAKLPPGIEVHQLDMSASETFEDFAAGITQPIDVLVNNAGVYGPKPHATTHIEPELFEYVLRINSLGPVLLTRALLDRVAESEGKKLVTLTSIMASFGQNTSGSAPMYRASKAAVNMLMQCLSIELAPRGVGVLLIHPGWARTDMGGDAADLDVTESAAGVRQVIDDFDPTEQLAFRAWDGRSIPW